MAELRGTVSCRVVDQLIEGARRQGYSPEEFLAGIPYDRKHLSNTNEWIDWDSYLLLLERLRRGMQSEAQWVDFGRETIGTPGLAGLAAVATLLFDPRSMMKWVFKFGGFRLFKTMSSAVSEHGATLELRLTAQNGAAGSKEFFWMCGGALSAFPRMVGDRDVPVMVELQPDSARYRVMFPEGRGLWKRSRERLSSLFGALRPRATLIRGFEKDQLLLEERYRDLESAKQVVEHQKHELEVISVVAAAAHASLDLESALRAICVQVCGQLKYDYARFAISATQDGVVVSHVAEYGARTPGDTNVVAPLSFRGVSLGELIASRTAEITPDERRFFSEVATACALAVNNAIAFEVIQGYRKDLEDRVSERTTQLASALEQVQLQQAARQRIFQNISHELRTPLSLIGLSTGDILYRDGRVLTDKSKERLGQIDDSIQRLLHLFDGMLLLAAGQEGKLRIRPVQTDLAISLRSLVSAWQLAAQKHGIELHYSGAERLGVRVDDAGVERLVSNLLSNAIKFTAQGGSIEVRLEELDAQHIRIAVQDSGVGMDREFLGRVFGRFEQGPAPVRSGERGSGIGLAIVKEIAEAHGGSASVESERGRGSTFFVALPRDQDLARLAQQGDGSFIPAMQEMAPADAPRPVSNEAWPAGRAAAATVLVAEDDPTLRQFLVDLLSREYRVVAAPDGLAALRLAKEHQPALLVSDIAMPGIDGLELTKRFRASSGDKLAPVILLTAYAMVENRLQGLEAGAIDYLTKPFHPEELLARVKGQLQLHGLAMRLHEAQRLAGLGILSAGLAHELRNPANGVVNALEPLKKALPPEVLKEGTMTAALLDAMTAGAEQIAMLTRQLLGFSRQGELDVREEALNRILDSATALVEPAMKGRVLMKQLDYTGNVRCARGLVVQVLVNLLENAAHASPQGSEILLTTRVEGDRIVFDVRDAGPGVPKELRGRIFDPFFTTKAPGQGTGLGLTISRMIAERHGGALRLLETEVGAVFRLELPLLRVALPKTSPLLDAISTGGSP